VQFAVFLVDELVGGARHFPVAQVGRNVALFNVHLQLRFAAGQKPPAEVLQHLLQGLSRYIG
jgi:hypothetical protein